MCPCLALAYGNSRRWSYRFVIGRRAVLDRRMDSLARVKAFHSVHPIPSRRGSCFESIPRGLLDFPWLEDAVSALRHRRPKLIAMGLAS